MFKTAYIFPTGVMKIDAMIVDVGPIPLPPGGPKKEGPWLCAFESVSGRERGKVTVQPPATATATGLQ